MGNNGAPFGGKGRPINPRFSLNNEPEGVDTEDFSPKRNVGSVPERARRSAPKSFGDAEVSPSDIFLPSSSERRASPNSMFGSSSDGLSLDIGVNDSDSDSTPVVQPKDVPRPAVERVQSASTVGRGLPGGYGRPPTFGINDGLSLDIGVNDSEDQSADGGEVVVVKPLPPAASVTPPPVIPNNPRFVATPQVASVIHNSIPELKEIEALPDGTVESEDDGLSLDVGVNETDDQTVDEVEVVKPLPPVVTVPSIVPTLQSPKFEVPAPPVRPVRPVSSPSRVVNPLFADPVEDKPEDGLSLDVGVNETEDKPAKRVVSPLFDFKSDGFTPPKRKPEVRNVRPDSMIDTGSVESFDEVKKPRRTTKKVEPTRRPFQIQERDITLLRFLTKYQFSYVDAIARVLNSTPASINKRLRTLEEYELVKRQVIAAGSTLWSARKAGIELAGLVFKESKNSISFATIRHTIGLVNLAAELEREALGAKDILGLGDKFGEMFPVKNRFPGGIRLWGDEALDTPLTYGEMTVAEREIRQGQKRYRGGRSSAEMREMVDLAILSPEAPELEPGNEGLFVVYGHGGKTGEHVPDLVVSRPRGADGKPQHFAIELELTPKSPGDWKRILRSYRENGGMYSRVYYFTSEKAIANMILNADSEVGLGDRLVLRRYTPKNKRQPFLG